MPIAFQCDDCDESWPHNTGYARCPRCRTRCRTCLVDEVLTAQEAKFTCYYIQFEREYRLLEEKRERLGQISPEARGRQEAREFAAKWRTCVQKLRA